VPASRDRLPCGSFSIAAPGYGGMLSTRICLCLGGRPTGKILCRTASRNMLAGGRNQCAGLGMTSTAGCQARDLEIDRGIFGDSGRLRYNSKVKKATSERWIIKVLLAILFSSVCVAQLSLEHYRSLWTRQYLFWAMNCDRFIYSRFFHDLLRDKILHYLGVSILCTFASPEKFLIFNIFLAFAHIWIRFMKLSPTRSLSD
jgi:hypothetical protein